MTQLLVRKSVSSVVVQPTFQPSDRVSKAVSNVIVQPPFQPSDRVSKAVGVVVVQDSTLFTRALVSKATGVVVVQPDASGDAKQATALSRPAYRVGPKPYIEFGAGEALEVNIILPGTYTVILFKSDQTFQVSQVTLPSGPYALTQDFNQCLIYQGVPSRRMLTRIKATMIGRANP